MGIADEDHEHMTFDDYVAGLKRVPDIDIYPELAAHRPVTIAPKDLDEGAVFIKRPGMTCYTPGAQDMDGTSFAKDNLLDELLLLEQLSKRPHPYIVRYLGCRVRRGHITAIVLEALEWTLHGYATDKRDKFTQLDNEAFVAGVQSAVCYMHSLGLAHSDVNPNNIMVREADDGSCFPVLIDFNSSGPFGGRLVSAGSVGFSDPDDPNMSVSLKSHDEYSLDRVREGWDRVLQGLGCSCFKCARERAENEPAKDEPAKDEQ